MRQAILLGFFTLILQLQAQQSDFIEINFDQADKIASMDKGEDLSNLPLLTYRLNSQLESDVERFRAVYYWVTHNIKGSEHLTSMNIRQRKKLWNDTEALTQWNINFKKKMFKKLVEDKETLCSGYSYLMKKMATLAGIECEIINGYGLTSGVKSKGQTIANHSWNTVKFKGKWYVCDATWSAGYSEVPSGVFRFDYDDSYFLMEPSEFLKSHQPLDGSDTLQQ